MNRKSMFALLAVSTLTLSAFSAADTGLLAYEGFSNGPLLNLDGSNGGTGWLNSWTDTALGLNTRIVSNGLNYPGLPTQSGAAQTQDWNSYDWTLYERSFPAVSGDTLYVSFLYRATTGYGGYGGLSFGNYPAEVWVGSPLGYYTYGMRYGHYGFVLSNIPEIVGLTTLLVVEIKLLPDTSQLQYSLFVDPVPGLPRPLFPDAQAFMGGTALPTALRIDNDGGVITDEIRVASTWALALPGPCPGDVNGDNTVDLSDLTILLSNYGKIGNATYGQGDLSRDGNVDLTDLSMLLSYYGRPCN